MRRCWRATSRATGAVVNFGVIEMFEMDGDKITSVAPFYWDTQALRAPLGIA
jgi:ketosteroid isomerase-like protein